MSEDFPAIPIEDQPEEKVWHNPDTAGSEEAQDVPPQDTRESDEQDAIRAQLVATAVNDQMQTKEAIQLSEAKHMGDEFERHANDQTLPIRQYGIRDDGYQKYKGQYDEANREPDAGVEGVQKTEFNGLNRLRVHSTEGKALEDPYRSNSSPHIRYAEEKVVESEARLADMPIGPWNQVKRRDRYGSGRDQDKLVFTDKDTDGLGSEGYAKFARQRSETYARIAEINDEIAAAEREQADPATAENKHRYLSHLIDSRKAAVAELEGDDYRYGTNPLGYIDEQEQGERRDLSYNRQELAKHYAGGAEYYRAVSERLNNNLNNVAQQFEDFYDLAPETFSGKSSKEFLDAAKEYFGLKEDVRQAEFAAKHATGLLGSYEDYIDALRPDSDKDIGRGDISVQNLDDKIRYYFGASGNEWECFEESIEGLDGEALKERIEDNGLTDGGTALATTENLMSYVVTTRQITAEWLDSSPRQTLEKYQGFAKGLQEKQQAELKQKQDKLNEFVAGLKGGQENEA